LQGLDFLMKALFFAAEIGYALFNRLGRSPIAH
jgi:hypothetical protein